MSTTELANELVERAPELGIDIDDVDALCALVTDIETDTQWGEEVWESLQ